MYTFLICYIVVGSYSFDTQRKVLMGGFCDRLLINRHILSASFNIPNAYPAETNDYECPMAT